MVNASGSTRVALAGVAVTLALGLPGTPTSTAAVTSLSDQQSDDSFVVASTNVLSARVDNGDNRLSFRLNLEKVTKSVGKEVSLKARNAKGEAFYLRTRWRKDGTLVKRITHHVIGATKTIKCPQLRASWVFGTGGHVRMSAPRKCIPAQGISDIYVGIAPASPSEYIDFVRRSSKLPKG